MEPAVDPQPLTTSVGQVPMDRLRTIFDGMFDGVWLVDTLGLTTYANAAMARLVGSTPTAMRGRPVSYFVADAIQPDVTAFLARQETHAGERMEIRLRRDDGESAIGVVAGSPIMAADGSYVGTMLNVSDVTGKELMNEQMVQAHRLEAVGEFAGAVAHDFNNLLMAIQGYADMARARLPLGDPGREDLDRVLLSTERASVITRKLLAFTRRQVLAPVDVDPGQVIADLLPILRPLLGSPVDVLLHVEPPRALVRVDVFQLEQVIVNLAINARDAMPDGGILTITVESGKPVDTLRPDPDLTAGPFVRISVADTGVGMDEATRERIFEPFFTTKAPGRGTGLGLATIFGIVAQSGGHITVESSPGHGATFLVDLPLVGLTGLVPLGPPSVETRERRVVLLVEDEPSVRDVVAKSLDRLGYRVIVVADGGAAIEASKAAGTIDILLTDILMPGIRGPQLAARIRERRPDIAVVFMSGYSEGAGADGATTLAGQFLSKPFSPESLAAAMERALAG